MMIHLLAHAHLMADVPNFSNTPPPGSDKLLKIGSWVLYTVSALCVIGLLMVGGRLAVSHHHGIQGGQHGEKLGAVMTGIVIVGAASGIAGALI
jgi:hypothetical protein